MTEKENLSKKKSMLKDGLSLTVLTFVSRVLGLVREMTKSAFMGTGLLADAFAVAFLIPNLLRRLFAENSITIAFIPTFKKYLHKLETAENTEEKKLAKQNSRDFLSAIFTLLSFLTTATVVLGIIFTPIILKVFFPESTEDFPLTVLLTRIMFPYLVVISLAAFFQGILNSVKVFTPSGFTPILFNIAIISFTHLLTPVFDNPAIAMSIGVIVGGFIQAFFQLPFIFKAGQYFSFTSLKNAFTNDGTKKVIRLIVPTLFGMAAFQLNDLVASGLGKNAGLGVLSSLQYSLRLQELLLGIFVISVGTVILPDLSAYATKKDWKSFEGLFLQAIEIVALITIPATFFAFFSSEHIISLVYKIGNFDDNSVRLTMQAFNFHILGLFFISLTKIVAPAFYAQGDTKHPTIAGVICFAVNMLLASILVKPMVGGGIALALSIASATNALCLFIFLRKNKNLNIKKILSTTFFATIKITIFSIIASLPLLLFSEKIYTLFAGHRRLISEGFPLFINFLIFAFVGVALLFLTGDKLLKNLIARFFKK
ncbi:MAG: murein biosynthesis integral membrane protein MurJ [Treponemataceae bacterium]